MVDTAAYSGLRWGELIAAPRSGELRDRRHGQEAGTNTLGLIFPSPWGTYWRSSDFNRRVLGPGHVAAGWRDADGNGRWTWHSLRHVFCTTALCTSEVVEPGLAKAGVVVTW